MKAVAAKQLSVVLLAALLQAPTASSQKCLANLSPRWLKSINPSSPLELMQCPLKALYSD